MALAGEEGRGKLRKASGSGKHALIRGFPNGKTHPACGIFMAEFIGHGDKRGELKHLSSPRKRK